MTCKQNNLWKNVLALVMLILLCPQAKAEDVYITVENFPDPNFRNYVKNVMWQHNGGSNTFGSNPCYDGVITDAEQALLTVINMEGRGSDPSKVVTDMTGVQLLTRLERLNLVGHQVTNLDLSGMTNLNTVYATSNQLEEVNVSGCTSLRTICVMNNQIGTAAMGRFVESLPTLPSGSSSTLRLYMVNAGGSGEGNQILIGHVETANSKGWNWVREYDKATDKWAAFTHIAETGGVPLTLTHFSQDLIEYIQELAYEDNKARIDRARAENWLNYHWHGKPTAGFYNPFYLINSPNAERVFYNDPTSEYTYIKDDTILTALDIYHIRELNIDRWNVKKRKEYEEYLRIQEKSWQDHLKELYGEELGQEYFEQHIESLMHDYQPKLVTDLRGIQHLTYLEHLYCDEHELTNLDVSGMKNLRILRCHKQGVTNGCGGLQTLNVSGCENLRQLYCDSNALASLDLTGLHNLKMLRANNNPNMTSLVLPETDALTYADIYNLGITSLDMSNHPNLEVLHCYQTRELLGDGVTERHGKLRSLDVTQCSKLKELRCSNNPIQNLDLSGNPNLEILYCNFMDLSEGHNFQDDLYNLTKLRKLSCNRDTLDALDVSGNPLLTELYCWDNKIQTLDLSNNPNLEILVVGDNQSGHDARGPRPNGGNELTTLDVSNNLNLTTLYCAKNQLADLDLSGLENLADLNYAEQERTVRAENSLLSQWNGGTLTSKNLYFLRMDATYDANPNQVLQSRLSATDHEGISNFDISLVDSQSWTGGSTFQGTRSNARKRVVGTTADLDADRVYGNVLVLSGVTETATQATGSVTYNYDIKLDPNATAVDARSPFTLNWYAVPGIVTEVSEVATAKEVKEVKYVSMTGVESSEPWPGVNVVVTTYADGSEEVNKMIAK